MFPDIDAGISTLANGFGTRNLKSFFAIEIDLQINIKDSSYFRDVNANCTNTNGSHKCTCKEGYPGDGQSCQGTTD